MRPPHPQGIFSYPDLDSNHAFGSQTDRQTTAPRTPRFRRESRSARVESSERRKTSTFPSSTLSSLSTTLSPQAQRKARDSNPHDQWPHGLANRPGKPYPATFR